MIKLVSRFFLVFTLLGLFSITAWRRPRIASGAKTNPLQARDGATGASYTAFVSGNATFAWTQATVRAFARAHVVVTPALNYDFTLVSITGSDNDIISGRWVIRRNGAVVCNNCIGRAYGLSQPVGNYFKIYVGTAAAYDEKWHYSGYITDRFDF